jgi:hypothetical protein
LKIEKAEGTGAIDTDLQRDSTSLRHELRQSGPRRHFFIKAIDGQAKVRGTRRGDLEHFAGLIDIKVQSMQGATPTPILLLQWQQGGRRDDPLLRYHTQGRPRVLHRLVGEHRSTDRQ